MRACCIRQHGGPEALFIADLEKPAPGPGEALLEIRAAGLNHLDLNVRNGGGRFNLLMPHVIGSDASGIVVETGPGVDRALVGQAMIVYPGLSCGGCEYCQRGEQNQCVNFGILGAHRAGIFAEYAAVPAQNLFPKPDYLSFEEAAALTISYLTAWRMLVCRARVLPGETLLIHGIGGGVALAGLQIGKMAGAKVIVTSSSPAKLSRAKELGADDGVDYRSRSVAEAIQAATEGRGVDVVIDSVGAATWELNLDCVRRGGRIVLCGVNTGAVAPTNLQKVYWNHLSLLGSTFGSAEDLRLMLRAFAASRIRPVLSDIFPLAKAREALDLMEQGKQFGKIALRMPRSED